MMAGVPALPGVDRSSPVGLRGSGELAELGID
jgi:hypothetical protein